MLGGDSGKSAPIQCRCTCTGVVSTLFTHNICNSGHFKLYPRIIILATDILTNSSLSCELAIHDLIGINVHSTVLRKIWWFVCAISLFRSFVFSPGVVARRKDEITPSEKTK